MSNLALRFFRYGPEIPGIKELQQSSYPYRVLTSKKTIATAKDIEPLFKSVQKDSLQDRVQRLPGHRHYTVDKFFRVGALVTAPRENALKLWSHLRSRCQVITIGTGLAAVGLTLLALRGTPLYIEVALFVGTVVSCCFAGWGYQRVQIADHQLAAWRNPGEDFALRRKADLELPLEKISQKKCHYDGSKGTLLGLEILSLLTQHFKHFAAPLLARTCDQPYQQHQWVVDFFTSNPLMINFLKDNPGLLSEQGWEDVFHIQMQIVRLQQALKGDFVAEWKAQISKHEKDIKTLQKHMIQKLRTGIEEVAKQKKMDVETAFIYQRRLLQALNEVLFLKLFAVIQQQQERSNCPLYLFYPKVRNLLEQAHLALIEHKPYTLDEAAFASLIPNIQSELSEITDQYGQNLIDKAKSLAPDDQAYQRFLAGVFRI